MKKTKIIIPALGILLLSTAASVTGTVAWFSATSTVSATGMQLRAKAETGIVIANQTGSGAVYKESIPALNQAVTDLYPGSTADLNSWYHSTSSDTTLPNTGAAYTTGTAWADADVLGNYVVHEFYIRASAAEAITVTSLNVKNVEVKVGEASPAQELSKALRVGVRFGAYAADGNKYIYAPVSGGQASYTTNGGAVTVNATPVAGTESTWSKDTNVTSIPGNTNDGIHTYVYIWFEGEDNACVSKNIVSSLETISVAIEFCISKPAA